MRRPLAFAVGILVGQWLAFSGGPSPADLHERALAAFQHRDYAEAMRLWSRAVALAPDNPTFHYLRGAALAQLGMPLSAADAYRTSLLLEPPGDIARQAREGLSRLTVTAGRATPHETTVPLETGPGVWIASVVLNGTRPARFLLDTGSSVVVVAPAVAAQAGAHPVPGDPVELDTIAGRASGPSATLASLRLGDAELRDAPVVLHDPGSGVDGILGNTFLRHYRVTLDADRRELHLRPLARD